VSASSVSRFEAGISQPGFADACAIAKALGAPLLFLADGRDRTGNDPRDLIAHLAYWGLNDLAPGEVALVGEARPFEDLVVSCMATAVAPRILEAIPSLLLKNDFSAPELEGHAIGAGVLHRLGWLAEIAEWIASQISVSRLHPSASAKVTQVRRTAWSRRQKDFAKQSRAQGQTEGWDLLENLEGSADSEAIKRQGNSSPIAKKWRIAYATPQEEFLTRARDILAASESG
jgi:transcriptional regulator with XRE-family HTH domain